MIKQWIKSKNTEHALRQKLKLYQNIIEKSDDIIWTADLNLHTTYISPSIEKKLGFTPEEMMAKDLEMQVTPSSYKAIMELLSKELEREQDENVDPERIINYEIEYYHKNGSILWYEVIASGLRDENRILTGIHGISRDITEKKLSDKRIRESEEKFRLLAENAGDVIYKVKIADEQYIYASPSVEKLLGYTTQEVLSLKVQDTLTSESYSKQRNSLIEALEKGKREAETLEVEAIRKDGRLIPIEVKATLVYDNLGNPVEILGVARDITERKRIEEEKEKLANDLKERVKELNCLYSISSIIEIPDISIEEKLQKIVNVLPPAWQYPDITCAKITIDEDEYKTVNYQETRWKQASEIIVTGTKAGVIEVCYLEERAEIIEGPFLQQERNLINAIAERLGRFIERMMFKKQVKILEGILPICSSCKKIRTPEGSYEQMESYITSHSEAYFSHGICPDCVKKLYPTINLAKNNSENKY